MQCHTIAQFVLLVERKHETSLTKKTTSHMKSQARTNKKWHPEGTQRGIDVKDRVPKMNLALFTSIHNLQATTFLKCQKSILSRKDKCKHRATVSEGSST